MDLLQMQLRLTWELVNLNNIGNTLITTIPNHI